jgi:hypothetical protein
MASELVCNPRNRQPGRVQRLEPIEQILGELAALARDFRLHGQPARR